MLKVNSLFLICLAKAVRTFGFGAISVILVVYLMQRGFDAAAVGAVISATLVEDAVVTTLSSTLAINLGRRRVLLFSSLLIVFCGLLLATTHDPWLIVCAAVFGIVSPAGYEGGPFGPVEQTVISEVVPGPGLTRAFSWYNLTGFAGAALGALFAGNRLDASYMFFAYAFGGAVLFSIYLILPIPAIKDAQDLPRPLASAKKGLFAALHLGKSRGNVFKLSALQALDSFGGGFVAQSLIAYWFYARFHAGPEFVGPVFFWANILAAVSFTIAPHIAERFGLLRTMVFTHLPCSIALGIIAFMPSASAAACLLLCRSLFSSMDIPVRQAYTMLLVEDVERPAAAGITNAARAVAQGVAPLFAGLVMNGGAVVLGIPFICAGVAKSLYDMGLYMTFRGVSVNAGLNAPEQTQANRPASLSANLPANPVCSLSKR